MAEDDEDMWIEKEISAPVSSAPAPAVSVASKSEQKSNTRDNEDVKVDEEADKGPKRDSWMTDAGGMDFGLMGALKVKKPKEDKPNPDKVHIDFFPFSHRNYILHTMLLCFEPGTYLIRSFVTL